MNILLKYIALFKNYGVIAITAIIAFFAIFLRFKNSQLKKAEIKLQQNVDDNALDKEKTKELTLQTQVNLDEKSANDAEAKLMASLKSDTSRSTTGLKSR